MLVQFIDEVSQLLRHPGLEILQKPRVTAWYPEHHTTFPLPDGVLGRIDTAYLYLSDLQAYCTLCRWTYLHCST